MHFLWCYFTLENWCLCYLDLFLIDLIFLFYTWREISPKNLKLVWSKLFCVCIFPCNRHILNQRRWYSFILWELLRCGTIFPLPCVAALLPLPHGKAMGPTFFFVYYINPYSAFDRRCVLCWFTNSWRTCQRKHKLCVNSNPIFLKKLTTHCI